MLKNTVVPTNYLSENIKKLCLFISIYVKFNFFNLIIWIYVLLNKKKKSSTISWKLSLLLTLLFSFVRKRQTNLSGSGPHWLQHASYCHLPETNETAVYDCHWEGECDGKMMKPAFWLDYLSLLNLLHSDLVNKSVISFSLSFSGSDRKHKHERNNFTCADE